MDGTVPFGGVDDHYFLSAALPKSPARTELEYQPVPVTVPGSDSGLQFVSWSVRFANPPTGERFFFGPKDFDVLRSVDPDLVRAIDFGMFDWLVVPLLRALKWVNGYVGNYGWSIIVLTILINLAMFPLRHKSVVSMRKMQELQPEVKAIQDRYAKLKMTDPGSAEDERRADESLSRARREPGERLRADAADDAGAVRVLRDAVGGHRAARRAVRRLDPRPLRVRSAVHHAGADGHHAVRPDRG